MLWFISTGTIQSCICAEGTCYKIHIFRVSAKKPFEDMDIEVCTFFSHIFFSATSFLKGNKTVQNCRVFYLELFFFKNQFLNPKPFSAKICYCLKVFLLQILTSQPRSNCRSLPGRITYVWLRWRKIYSTNITFQAGLDNTPIFVYYTKKDLEKRCHHS